MKKRKYFWMSLTLLWVVVIFSFSMQNSDTSNGLSMSLAEKVLCALFPNVSDNQSVLKVANVIVRKAGHFCEYGVLGSLAMISLLHTDCKKKILFAFGFCAIIALLDECLQLFVDGRWGNAADVLLDCSGGFTGIVLILGCVALIRGKSEKSIK